MTQIWNDKFNSYKLKIKYARTVPSKCAIWDEFSEQNLHVFGAYIRCIFMPI